MLRRLLALLALITGLAATGTSVHAAEVGAIAGHVEAGCELAAQGGDVRLISAISETKRIICLDRSDIPAVRKNAAPLVPAARIGPDRALE